MIESAAGKDGFGKAKDHAGTCGCGRKAEFADAGDICAEVVDPGAVVEAGDGADVARGKFAANADGRHRRGEEDALGGGVRDGGDPAFVGILKEVVARTLKPRVVDFAGIEVVVDDGARGAPPEAVTRVGGDGLDCAVGVFEVNFDD